MSKVILKHGKLFTLKLDTKIYTATCPLCGCKFTCTRKDFEFGVTDTPVVSCPECGQYIWQVQDPLDKPVNLTNANIPITLRTGATAIDCENCPNKPDPTKITIGDTPCTWCIKRQITC